MTGFGSSARRAAGTRHRAVGPCTTASCTRPPRPAGARKRRSPRVRRRTGCPGRRRRRRPTPRTAPPVVLTVTGVVVLTRSSVPVRRPPRNDDRVTCDNCPRMFLNGHDRTGPRASVRDMGHRRWRWRWLAPGGDRAALVPSGCSRAVAGVPSAAPGPSATRPRPSTPGRRRRRREPGSARRRRARRRVPARRHAARGAADRPVRAEQAVVRRTDGTRSTSCTSALPTGRGNRWRRSTSTGCGRARPRRPCGRRGRALPGLGEATALLETAAGPTLQVASPRFLVTLLCRAARRPTTPGARARRRLTRLPP
jgi:hypothetical protein